jgi:hypothetical protein
VPSTNRLHLILLTIFQFPEKNGALVSCISIEPDFAEGLEEMFTLREDLKMVRKVGCYVVALTSTGKLLFYDENMILVNAMTLCKETEDVQEILDFEFIDVDEHEAFEKTVKILLKVRTKAGVQVHPILIHFNFKVFNFKTVQNSPIQPTRDGIQH